jgi:hypothetical protein
MSTIDQSLEIDVNDSRMILDTDIPEKAQGSNTDAIIPNIEAAKTLNGLAGECRDLCRIANISWYRQPVATRRFYLHNKAVEGTAASRRDDYVGAPSLSAVPRPTCWMRPARQLSYI